MERGKAHAERGKVLAVQSMPVLAVRLSLPVLAVQSMPVLAVQLSLPILAVRSMPVLAVHACFGCPCPFLTVPARFGCCLWLPLLCLVSGLKRTLWLPLPVLAAPACFAAGSKRNNCGNFLNKHSKTKFERGGPSNPEFFYTYISSVWLLLVIVSHCHAWLLSRSFSL